LTSELTVLTALLVLAVIVIVAGLWSRSSFTRPGTRDDQLLADLRAQAMLCEVLTEQEQQNLARNGYLEVPSPSKSSRSYRIPGRRGQVTLCEDGVPIATLCVQPTVPVPDADLVVMHKVLIEADEATYLSVANRFRFRRTGLTRGPDVLLQGLTLGR
jgi:hypothetical protein